MTHSTARHHPTYSSGATPEHQVSWRCPLPDDSPCLQKAKKTEIIGAANYVDQLPNSPKTGFGAERDFGKGEFMEAGNEKRFSSDGSGAGSGRPSEPSASSQSSQPGVLHTESAIRANHGAHMERSAIFISEPDLDSGGKADTANCKAGRGRRTSQRYWPHVARQGPGRSLAPNCNF